MFGVTSVSTVFRGNMFTAPSALCSEVGCHFCAIYSVVTCLTCVQMLNAG